MVNRQDMVRGFVVAALATGLVAGGGATPAAGAPGDELLDIGSPGLLTLESSPRHADIRPNTAKDWYITVHNEGDLDGTLSYSLSATGAAVDAPNATFFYFAECSVDWVRSTENADHEVVTEATCPGALTEYIPTAEARTVIGQEFSMGTIVAGGARYLLLRISRGNVDPIYYTEPFTVRADFSGLGDVATTEPPLITTADTGVRGLLPALMTALVLIVAGIAMRLRHNMRKGNLA